MAPPTRLLVEEEMCTFILTEKRRARQSMMASTCRHHFLTQRLSLKLMAFLVMTLISYGRGSNVELTGEVGGNVTIPCLADKQKSKDFVYLQRGNQFVNGYYASKDVRQITWPNTKFNREQSSVFMYNLNLSHSGKYSCHIRYNDSSTIAETTITLNVTAKYSKPTFTAPVCREQSCHVICRSYGGHPKAQMTIRAVVGNTSSQTWGSVTSNEFQNSSTFLYDSSSTVNYNCSSGEITFRCSVGDVTSDDFSVCADQKQHNTLVIGATICIVVVVMVTAVVLCCRRRTGRNGRRARVPINDEVEIATIKEAA